MEVRFVQVGEIRTRCLVGGSGPPILLLHGFHGFAEHWTWVLPLLANRFTCYAIDLLGHGQTDWPTSPYRLRDFGRHVRGTLDALELERIPVVGNSLGGAVATWLAINAPDRVERLMLLCPAGYGGATRLGALQFSLGVGEVAARVRTRRVANLSRRIQFADPTAADPAFFRLKAVDAGLRRSDPGKRRVTLRQSRALARVRPVDPALVRTATLVIWGEADRGLSFRRALPLLRRLPDARIELLPGCGHLPHVECPDEVARLVLEFLTPEDE